MNTTATRPRLSTDASNFLQTLLFTADHGDKATSHVKNWTIHEFHPEFVDALETFLSGFRESLANSHPDIDPDECERSFGGNVYFSLSGHGCGFFDERGNGDELQAALEAFSGSRYRFEELDGTLSKFHGEIHLAYRTAAFRREYLAKLFGGFTVATDQDPRDETEQDPRDETEQWLNELGVPEEEKESNGGRIPDDYEDGESGYGTWMRKHDKIAFNITVNERHSNQ